MPDVAGAGAVPRPSVGRRSGAFAATIVVLICVLVYMYPWVATTMVVGKTALPPIFAPDQTTYMSMGKMIRQGASTDPWYGLSTAGISLPYHTFSLSLVAFESWRGLHGGSWYWASLTWDIAWIALTCAALWLLMRQIFPEAESWITAAAVLFLMLFAADALPLETRAWLHLGGSEWFGLISLPLVRMYYPQTILAPACLYAALLISALRRSTFAKWAVMVLLQFLLLWAFPYAAMWIALATGISLLALFASPMASQEKPRIKTVLAFALACALVDLAFIFLHAHGATGGGPVLAINLGLVRGLIGGTVILTLALSVVLLLFRRDAAAIVLVSLGIADVMLLMGNAFFSNQLQVTHHAGYFVQIVIGLLLMATLFQIALTMGFTRIATISIALIAIVNGAAIARGTFHHNLQMNLEQAQLQRAVTSVGAGPQDLLVLPAAYVDDAATWTPLLTNAYVLYAPNAELVMPPEDKERLHSERQSTYLYLRGIGKQWIESALASPGSPQEGSLEMLNERALVASPTSRAATLDHMRGRLEPRLDALANGTSRGWMRSSRRVIILDRAASPVFDPSRLNQLFQIKSQQVLGEVIVREASVR